VPAVVLRSATARDAGADTGVFLASRAAAMPWLPNLHSTGETRWWVEHVVLAECVTWLATDADGSLAGCAGRRGSGNEEGLPDLRYGWPPPPGPAR
jgi:hypothetical protein